MFSLNSVTKIFVIKRARTSSVRDQDATTVPARHVWETGSLNWPQFTLQWFIWFPEFAEFTEFQLNLGKTPIAFTELPIKRRNYTYKTDWVINYKIRSTFLCSFLPEKVKLTTFWELRSSPSMQNCIKIEIDFYASVQVLVEVLNEDEKV